MKIFLLRTDVGDCWFDKVDAMVVVAPDEDAARSIASRDHGAEPKDVWTTPTSSTCDLIGFTDLWPEGLVCRSLLSA